MLQNKRLNFLNQKDQIQGMDLVFSVSRKSPSGRGFFDEGKVVLWGGDSGALFNLLLCWRLFKRYLRNMYDIIQKI